MWHREKISSKAVENFTSIFKTNDVRTKKSSIIKAYRWFKNRQEFLDALSTKENKALTITRTSISGVSVKRCSVKALSGRGRIRADWVNTCMLFYVTNSIDTPQLEFR